MGFLLLATLGCCLKLVPMGFWKSVDYRDGMGVKTNQGVLQRAHESSDGIQSKHSLEYVK